MTQRKPYFNKETSNILKGIALIMMFIHHFFTFPEWWVEGVYYQRIAELALYFRNPFKLCVAVFAFITGYIYFYNKQKTYKYSLKKISDILIPYWIVFLILGILAKVFVHYDYTLVGILQECFALWRPTMSFCWYVNFYISVMLLLPLFSKIMSKNIIFDLFFGVILVPQILIQLQQHAPNPLIAGIFKNLLSAIVLIFIGYIFASYELFEKLEGLHLRVIKNKWINLILMVIVAVLVPMGRYFKPSLNINLRIWPVIAISLDILYTPIFIYAVNYICNTVQWKIPKRILTEIGKYSLLMWFVSCIFYSNSREAFQPILYLPHNPFLVLIWGLFFCYAVSFLVDLIVKPLQRVKNAFFFK